MKGILTVVMLFISLGHVSAQNFRLSYDPATVPELYNTTRIYLEEEQNGVFRVVKGKYRLYSEDAGQSDNGYIKYTEKDLNEHAGVFHFTVEIGGRRLPLDIQLPVLRDIRFNLYTDSIKPVLNYYVNVEGTFSSGRVFPLGPEQVELSADQGSMRDNEWILPKERRFEKVKFTAVSLANPHLERSVTLYIKKYPDPRDAEGYEDGKDGHHRQDH